MEYTKGKWKVYTDNMVGMTDIVVEDGTGFFTETIASIRRTNKNYKANAHLIVSAPKLYEALKVVKDALENNQNNGKEALQFAIKASLFITDKALAKAEGK